MTVALLLVAVLAVALAAVYRQRLVRSRRYDRMRQRLVARYPEASAAGDGQPLVSPPGPRGLALVAPEGLLIALGDEPGLLPRLVEWPHITHLSGAGSRGVVVGIARVGDIVVASGMGRELWERTRRRGTRSSGVDGEETERSRELRV